MARIVYAARRGVQGAPLYVASAELTPKAELQYSPDDTLLLAVIKKPNERFSLNLLPERLNGASWQKPLRVGGIEVIVSGVSRLKLHEPKPSESDDSDAYYFGENSELGMLLQCLGPKAWRTRDPAPHTSAHHHNESSETYHALYGTGVVELRDVNTGERLTVEMGGAFGCLSLTVPRRMQHPVVVRDGSPLVTLIVTTPPNITRSDHNYEEGLHFRDIFP